MFAEALIVADEIYYLRESHNCPRTFDTNFMSIILLKCYSCSIIGPDSSASDDDKPERKETNTVEPMEKENVSLSTEFKRNAVITRADGKSQVRQCFGC